MAGAAGPIYLDHNATTPVDPAVLQAMLPYFTEVFGNSGSIEHAHGNAAAEAVRNARGQVAAAIGARDNEIIFTGSCTEANNLAILGMAKAEPAKRHAITTAVEHPSIIEPFRQIEREGWQVTFLPVDEHGMVTAEAVVDAMRADTAFVSVMAANNEVGTLQPIAEIGRECESRGIIFHSDLAQTLTTQVIDVTRDCIHVASLSGHKAYGPKGIGALYARSRGPRVRLTPIVHGGGQEKGLRSGTLDVPAIVGLAKAISIARSSALAERERLLHLTSAFMQRMCTGLDGVMLNGHPKRRLPGNLSLSIAGVEPLALIRRTSQLVSFSASSACSTQKVETSHVLKAMFGDGWRSRAAFRISPGRYTTLADMVAAAEGLVTAASDLKRSAA